jgi:hypothetical protein
MNRDCDDGSTYADLNRINQSKEWKRPLPRNEEKKAATLSRHHHVDSSPFFDSFLHYFTMTIALQECVSPSPTTSRKRSREVSSDMEDMDTAVCNTTQKCARTDFYLQRMEHRLQWALWE